MTKISNYYGWLVTDKKALLDAIAFDGELDVALPCGHIRRWTPPYTHVPETDLECHCEELSYRHWFIKYGERG